ncbi:MAG: hypothetical protein MUO76_24645, partial [Anaerolineaceae bacterium]|nr:hypothetical protein [Anaerolineaceae bacterium]
MQRKDNPVVAEKRTKVNRFAAHTSNSAPFPRLVIIFSLLIFGLVIFPACGNLPIGARVTVTLTATLESAQEDATETEDIPAAETSTVEPEATQTLLPGSTTAPL